MEEVNRNDMLDTEENREAAEQMDEAQEEIPQEDTGKGLIELKAEVEEFKDKYLRAYAEIENMKKRQQRDRLEIIKFANEAILKDFLLIYDALEKSIALALQLHPDNENFIQGLRMTEKLFIETLKKHNVKPIEAENATFDPNYHEAMMQVKRDDIGQGIVINEIEKGFMLHERVLRPAKVTVSG